MDTSRDSALVAKIAGEVDNLDTGILGGQLLKQRVCLILAAIIDEKQFVIHIRLSNYFREPIIRLIYNKFLVITRDNN